MSKHVLREAIEVLRRAGVVRVKRGNNGGTQVLSTDLRPVLAGLAGTTRTTIRSILEARRPLELTGALLAVRRADDAELEQLITLADKLEPLFDLPHEFLQTDALFHLVLVRAGRNSLIAEFHERVIDEILIATAFFPYGRIDPHDAIRHQRSTAEAIASRNPQRVRAALDDHLGALEVALLGEQLG